MALASRWTIVLGGGGGARLKATGADRIEGAAHLAFRGKTHTWGAILHAPPPARRQRVGYIQNR